MNIKRTVFVTFAAAALFAPSIVVAQADNSAPGGSPFPATTQPGSQIGAQPGSTGTQAGQQSSMRDSLGAPGQVGQEILDKEFIRTAVEEGLTDVKVGTLAVQKGGPEVKVLAQRLVDDHMAQNKDLETVADSLGVMVPKKVNKEGQAEYEKLSALSGKEFDTEYVIYVAKAHRQALHSYYMEASVAADPGLQAEVVKSLITMHQHIGLITKTATADGITLPPRPPRPSAATTAKN